MHASLTLFNLVCTVVRAAQTGSQSGTGPVQSRHTNQCERAQYSVCVTSANLQHPENRHLRLLVDTVLGELHVLVVSAAGEVEAA